jgi:hypothetical protein
MQKRSSLIHGAAQSNSNRLSENDYEGGECVHIILSATAVPELVVLLPVRHSVGILAAFLVVVLLISKLMPDL